MSDRKLTPGAKLLIKAKKLIENEDDWCPEGKGSGGLNKLPDGRVQRCAMQAVAAAMGYVSWYEAVDKRAVMSGYYTLVDCAPHGDVISVNRKGHKAVMALFNDGIQREMMKGAENDVSAETK